MSVLALKTVLTALHLGGVALGAGSAVLSFRFRGAERLEAVGLVILALSGFGLIFLEPATAAAPAFSAKMTATAVIAASLLLRRSGTAEAARIISLVSWLFAVVLGGLRDRPVSAEALLASYGACLAAAVVAARIRALTLRTE